jgi:polar amino acid transport system substrate-binding protein
LNVGSPRRRADFAALRNEKGETLMDKKTGFSRRGLIAVAGAAIAMPALMTTRAFAITPEEIKKRGRVIIGIQGDNPPWGFVNSAGKQEGIDADIGELFAKELGVQAQFMPLEVANRIPALTSGRVDVLFATMAMFPDRAKAVQFSKPYVANQIVLLAPKSIEIKTNADMAKVTISVARAAAQDTEVTKNAPTGTNILRLDGDAASIQAAVSGQSQAVGGNIFYIRRLEEAKPGMFEQKLVFSNIYNGACTRLGEKELNGFINSFVDKIKASGELKTITDKWMKADQPPMPEKLDGVPFTVS